MATFPVKWFSSDMGGHPVLGDTTAGDFIALIKACLITGFNVTPVTTMTHDATTGDVTMTLGTGHGFVKWQVIEVSGADQAEYNGQFRVTAIGSDWLTFTPDTAPAASPATGTTIEVKAAPHGKWEVVDEDAANYHLALRSTAADASPHTFMITNDGNGGVGNSGNIATVRILESFTDFSTYEEATSVYWAASHRQTTEEWLFLADDKMIFWVPRYANKEHRSVFVLGDIDTVRPGDSSHCLILGMDGSSTGEWDSSYDNPYTDFLTLGGLVSSDFRGIARGYQQLPGAMPWSLIGIGNTIGNLFAYPNLATNGFYVATGKLMVMEQNSLRGFMPGVIQPLQTSFVYHKAVIDSLPDLEGIPVIFWLATDSRDDVSDEYLIAFRLDQWRQEVVA